jgi:hypothetical protein
MIKNHYVEDRVMKVRLETKEISQSDLDTITYRWSRKSSQRVEEEWIHKAIVGHMKTKVDRKDIQKDICKLGFRPYDDGKDKGLQDGDHEVDLQLLLEIHRYQ